MTKCKKAKAKKPKPKRKIGKIAKTEIKDLSHPLPLPPFCVEAYGIDDS